MGRFLNPGHQLYKETRNGKVFIDKSGLIAYVNSLIGTPSKYLCVSRPRRFGKSTAAHMLVAYYECNNDAHFLFDDLIVAQTPDYLAHLNAYNVVQINIQNFLSEYRKMDAMIDGITRYLVHELKREYPDALFLNESNLASCLADIYAETGVQFVFVIDEWDCIFRIHRNDTAAQTMYLDFIRNLMKDQPYLAFAYMTGILPIKKYGQHSALNMFSEVSMTYAQPIPEFTAFTLEEVTRECKRHNMPLEEVRRWYDGYTVEGIEMFNPRSVVECMISGGFNNFWTQTETFEALKIYIDMDMDGLRGRIINLMAGEEEQIDPSTFTNDMVTFESSDDVLTLLVHLGYLTYDSATKRVRIPNYELAEQFKGTIRMAGWKEVAEALYGSQKLVEALLAGDEEAVAAGVAKAHAENTSILQYNDENSLACVLSLALYAARATHIMHRELPAGKGFADLAFVPRPARPEPALVVELKCDTTAEAALEQIREHRYADALAGYSGEVVACGIAYDRTTKDHTCRIERVVLP